jgi:hypothetical protein
MRLITAKPVAAPQDAEALWMSLWQLCVDSGYRGLTLLVLGAPGGPPCVGVSAANSHLEAQAAALVADCMGERERDEWWAEMVGQDLVQAASVSVRTLLPRMRNLKMDDPAYWGVRFDPLGDVFKALETLPEDTIAGVGVTVIPLRDGRARMSATAFGASSKALDAQALAARLSREYAVVGVEPRVSMAPKRDLRRMLRGQLSWMRSAERQPQQVTSFWHPPYAGPLELGSKR